MTDSIMRLLQGHMEEAALSSVGAGAEVGIWTSQVRYDALWYHPSRLINYKPLICILLSICCTDYRQVSLFLPMKCGSDELFLCPSRQRASSHVTCHSPISKKIASLGFVLLPPGFLPFRPSSFSFLVQACLLLGLFPFPSLQTFSHGAIDWPLIFFLIRFLPGSY